MPDPKDTLTGAVSPPAQTKPFTGYTVLTKHESGHWEIVASIQASSADMAIKQVVAKLPAGKQDGTFVAPTTRSWSPVKVSAKVETRLIIEEAN